MADPNRQYWNRQFKILQDTWPKPADFEGCIKICLELHAMVHAASMSNAGLWSFEDELWEALTEAAFRRVHKGNQSIAWKLWHAARIEDITMNLLIAGGPQLAHSGSWLEKMGAAVRDTGNAMNEEEIEALSDSLDMQALREYRSAVGRRTRSIIEALKPEDLKRKIEPSRLRRISEEGAVAKEAGGLIDYWGKKTFAGLLLMPATRHHLVHLNESMRLLGKKNTRAGREETS
jgi:hypothetical protein